MTSAPQTHPQVTLWRRGRRVLCLYALSATLGQLAGCAAAARPPAGPYGQEPTEVEPDAVEPRTIEEWEARQREHSAALAQLAGVAAEAKESERLQRDSRGEAGRGGRWQPADAEGRHPAQATRPAADRPAEPSSPSPGPPPPSPVTSPSGGDRAPRRYRVVAKREAPLRCRQVCRHVRAICQAASRICRIAGSLAEPAARDACRRGEARCAEAKGLAARICPSCTGEEGSRRSRPWRRWRSLSGLNCLGHRG